MRSIKQPPIQKKYKLPPMTVLCKTTAWGIARCSLCPKYWVRMNRMVKKPKSTSRAMIRPLDQAYWDPPYWSAKSKHTTATTNVIRPKGSNRMMISLRLRSLTSDDASSLERPILGMKTATAKAATPPSLFKY